MNRLLSITLVCLLHVSMALASAFNLAVEVTPVGAGSLNTSGGTYEEGSSIYLYTYRNTGYVFKGWYEGDQLVSSSTSFNYTMPSHDATLQARYEYDPTVPGDPAMPDTTTYYTLTTMISPNGAGSLNIYSGRYAAGANVYLYAYRNTGFKFLRWQDDEGKLVSESTSFSYTMPRRNVQLTAVYDYDPDVPANPDSMATRYTVTVKCKPMGGGSFNTNQATAEEGANVRLYAYTNTGYKFLRWEDSEGNTLSEVQDFYYVMPHGNEVIYGVFDFDPATPSNPAKNFWNKELGEVIVDDFTPNDLNTAVRNAIGDSQASEVAMITVVGRMGNYDFGIANNYENCTLLDLSRVTGVTEIPSYAFDYAKLESVYLPATVEKIGYHAFYECTQLASINLYAMTPPELDSHVFDGVPEGLVVYVPAAAIAQYQENEAWSQFTLMPIKEDIRNLTVQLPEGTNVADYAQMWLELTNTKNGQHMHYVMTDRMSYTFANIIRNTEWNVVLRSQAGDVFGQIDNVKVEDDDVTVTFASLTRPQNVSLTVMAGEEDVTQQVQVAWVDADGNYLAQGTSLTGLPVGRQVTYRISLSQDLAMAYQTPGAKDYTLKDGDNNIVCQLTAIPQLPINAYVKDMLTGLPIIGATVSASQTFDGRYSRTLNTKTNELGQFTLTVSQVPTQLTIAAPDYVSQTLTIDKQLAEGRVELPNVNLKSIVGATITLGFTYTSSAPEGQEPEVQGFYSDYQNVNYTIYNQTKQSEIGQFNVQYPQIVLLEEVADGDVLTLTATSRTASFNPVTATATVDGQRASVSFPIVELGRIEASFQQNDNRTVVGSLYDGNGKLLKTANYTNATLSFAGLADGSYTIVTMGSSRLFNTIYDLSQLPETGLVQGSDYVQNTVEVNSGVVSLVNIKQVPTLDESKLYYTGDGTSFTVNKSTIVAGNYLTLTGRIDFKTAYASNVSNVQMIVDLPESCSFVENSVMVGNSTSSYTLNGNRLTIPLVRYTDRVRFCVIPTLGGNYAPSAFAQFDLNGQSIIQPIGSANYTAKDLSINVPGTVAKTTIPVSGTAIGKSTIEIYDNDVLVGQTTSMANGSWATTCVLSSPKNLSSHNIRARVITAQGVELSSENVVCIYDMNAIQVSKVMMYHENPEMRKTYALTFDFQNPSDKEENYIYYIYNKKFTFTINFTNNNPEKVSNVTLYVKTAKSGWHPLTATYDAKQDIWVAAGEFGNMYDGDLPVNVSVDYTFDGETSADFTDVRRTFADNTDFQEAKEQFLRIDAAMEKFSANNMDTDLLNQTIEELLTVEDRNEIQAFEASLASLPDEEIDKLMDECIQHVDTADFTRYAGPTDYEKYFQFTKDGFTYEYSTCDQLSKQDVQDQYMPINTVDGDTVYFFNSLSRISFVDFASNVYLDISYSPEALARALGRFQAKSDAEAIWDWDSFLLDEKFFEKFVANENAAAQRYMKQLRKEMGILKRCKRPEKIAEYIEKISKSGKNLEGAMKGAAKAARYGKIVKYGTPVVDLAINGIQWYQKRDQVDKIINQPTECKSPENLAILDSYKQWGNTMKDGATGYHGLNFLLGTGAGFLIASAGVACPLSLFVTVPLAFGINYAADTWFDNKYEKDVQKLRSDFDRIIRKCKGDVYFIEGPGHHPGVPDKKFGIDPSGFVYEGVFSNRVEGATATVFYKEMVEDMYGDLHENIVKWDAEEYAQENPLFTDENGYYRWDVPTGLWQVKFEKEGYETTYSEWLPVPPPQLDVNIAMTQNVQPNVRQARAYEDAVEIEFDKYMIPDGLTTENITVLQNDEPVEGSIQLLNEEVSYEGQTDTYASRVRFNAAEPFSAKEITLVVKNRVQSYAGIRMQDDFLQKFAVELEVKQIVCDSLSVVTYGESKVIQVSVLPALASAGRTLNVATSSDMMLTLENKSVTIGEDGTATIIVTGELPGTAALTFTVSGSEVSATSVVSIEQAVILPVVALPLASIASGSQVEKGTEVFLSCETEGATIYYTLDGSCPCDENAQRYVYDGTPIVVNDSVTIRVMAVADGMVESEIAEYTYTVKVEDAIGDVALNGQLRIYPLPVRDKLNVTAGGNIIRSVSLYTVGGALVKRVAVPSRHVVLDTSSLAPGVYTVSVATEQQTVSRKVVKID